MAPGANHTVAIVQDPPLRSCFTRDRCFSEAQTGSLEAFFRHSSQDMGVPYDFLDHGISASFGYQPFLTCEEVFCHGGKDSTDCFGFLVFPGHQTNRDCFLVDIDHATSFENGFRV